MIKRGAKITLNQGFRNTLNYV